MLKQKGAGLIEFMIASSLGLISLAVVGSLYISGQKMTMERSKELMLLQNTASVLQMLKSDVQRAGFDGNGGDSLKISGATNTIYTSNDVNRGLVAYAYYIGVSGANPLYKNVIYEQRATSPKVLYVCEKKRVSLMHVNDFAGLTGCNKLFDEGAVYVNLFDVKEESVGSSTVSSAIVTISLGTRLVGAPSIHSEQSFAVKQRNWQ